MFNLEQAISNWRKDLVAAGLKKPRVLNELENHLREDVDQHVQNGSSPQDAFQAAVGAIGQASLLSAEFQKSTEPKDRLKRKSKAMFAALTVLLTVNALWSGEISLPAQILVLAGITLIALCLRGWRFPVPDLPVLATTAKRNLERAAEEAHRLHHGFIGTEHLLLGLMQSPTGVFADVLKLIDVDPEAVKREVAKAVNGGPIQGAIPDLSYTPRVKRALQLASKEAKGLKQTRVQSEHLFLGLLLERDGIGGQVLKKMGVEVETIRRMIVRKTGSNQGKALD
jgi:hypothetical protein